MRSILWPVSSVSHREGPPGGLCQPVPRGSGGTRESSRAGGHTTQGVGEVTGLSAVRRYLPIGVLAVVVAAPALVLGPTMAAANTVRITKTSASPYYVSRFVSPKRVTIRYTLSGHAHVTIVVQQAGHTVKTILLASGKSAGAHASSWTLKKSSGAWAAAGKYTIKIYAKDSRGHHSSPYPAKVYCYIDNTAPNVTVSGISTSSISPSLGETTTVTYSLSDNIQSAALRATLEILDGSGHVVRTIAATGVPQGAGRTFVWDGLASSGSMVPAGYYSTRVTVTDLAGNKRVSSVGFPIQVRTGEWSRDRALDLTAYTKVILRSDTRGDMTHVVWNDGSTTGNRIRYRRLDRFGNTAVAPVLVATITLDMGSDTRGVPDVAASPDGGAYVVWRGVGRSISFRGIWIARIDPAGRVAWKKMVFSETNTTYDILDPRVAVSANGLAHVVCWKEGGPSAIYYATVRPDDNANIGWTALASGVTGGQRKMPNIEIDGADRVHIAWYDAIDHPGTSMVGRREIYYTRLVYIGGYVAPVGLAGTIDRRRLTTTELGYSPEYYDAPEMAADPAGSLHLAWPDKTSATASNGIRYLKLAGDGTVAVASMVAFDGSITSPGPRVGRNQAIAAQPGGGARIILTARGGETSPYRLFQVDMSATGTAGVPLCITDSGGRTASDAEDSFASLDTDSRGVMHLVYAADSGAPLQGATQQRVTYRDFANDAASNDLTRADLEIDSAHVEPQSDPTPARQNTPVAVQAEVRNAGWAPILGGTATLWFEGVPVDTETFPGLAVEETRGVALHWAVPDNATSTPAALRVTVAPLGGTPQTASTNDAVSVPVDFIIPPNETNLIVEVVDETLGDYHWSDVPTPTVTLSGTTLGGAPYTVVGTPVGWRTQFLHVPLGTYAVSHAKAGYIVSPPASKAVTILRDPGDRYVLVTTPSNLIQLTMNRWGSIEGTVTESPGTTAVVGVNVTLLESDATSTTVAGGFYRFSKLCEGPVTIKAVKRGYERKIIATDVVAAEVLHLDVSMVPTTTGYATGYVTDEGGYPIVNDPDTTADDATVKVKGSPDRTFAAPGGRFDIRLLQGTYTLEFSAPGYVTRTVTGVVVYPGEEADATTDLVLNVSDLMHKTGPLRWGVAWTMHANWFGTQPPAYKNLLPLPSYNIKQWNGLFRFTFNGDYQTVAGQDYIRYVKPWFVGEAYEWTYFYGVNPPGAPHVFRYEQDLTGLDGDKYQPPMLSDGNPWNRTGVRVDGIDIVDQRDGSTVSAIRSSWTSCDVPDGYLYGSMTGAAQGDGPFPAYSHVVPWNDQVVRLWITIGKMNDEGHFANSTFNDLSYFNQGDLFQGSGYGQLQLYWRPTDNTMWVEPALIGYPNP
jgi:flagellar hook assembly protein FlgD